MSVGLLPLLLISELIQIVALVNFTLILSIFKILKTSLENFEREIS